MKTHTIRLFLSFTLVLALAMLAPSRVTAEGDPPSRVARLAFLEGEVSFSPAGADDWVAAMINRPITTGDRFWCDADARAELHIGSAAIRLGHKTAFSFLNLTDQMLQIRLTEGGISLRVRRLDANETIEIDTPNLAFSIHRPGRYRIDVNEAGDATIIGIREGEGEVVVANGATYSVHAGQQGYFRGVHSLHANYQSLPSPDAFDLWADARDNREDSYSARRYVSEDVIGYEDLNDDYGRWRTVPKYGHVWFPRVTVVEWAPYRHGHWAWVSPWGWTWIDDAPWGFAPFHYGRWVYVHDAWGWVPCRPRGVGGVHVRPVYAPALVAWVGGPRGDVAVGGVSWFPLGPHDVYMPSYPASRTYVHNVNSTSTTVNKTVINNSYNNPATSNVKSPNQNVAGAVTTVSSQSFSSAQPVSGSMPRIAPKTLASAPATTSAPAIAPPQKAVLGAGVATGEPSAASSLNRPVVVKTPPPPATPPFSTQQSAIKENNSRPVGIPQSHQLQPPATQAVVAPPVKILPKTQYDNHPNTRMLEDRPPTARSATPVEETKPAPHDTYRPQNPPQDSQHRQYESPSKTRTFDERPAAARPTMQVTPQIEFKPPQSASPAQPQPQPVRQEHNPTPSPTKKGKQSEQDKGSTQPQSPFK